MCLSSELSEKSGGCGDQLHLNHRSCVLSPKWSARAKVDTYVLQIIKIVVNESPAVGRLQAGFCAASTNAPSRQTYFPTAKARYVIGCSHYDTSKQLKPCLYLKG